MRICWFSQLCLMFPNSLVTTLIFIVPFYLLILGWTYFSFPNFSRWKLRLRLFFSSIIKTLLFGFQLLGTKVILTDRLRLYSTELPNFQCMCNSCGNLVKMHIPTQSVGYGAWDSAFLASSQVIPVMLIWGLHFVSQGSHCRKIYQQQNAELFVSEDK